MVLFKIRMTKTCAGNYDEIASNIWLVAVVFLGALGRFLVYCKKQNYSSNIHYPTSSQDPHHVGSIISLNRSQSSLSAPFTPVFHASSLSN
jgi:hypothetical protein